MPSYFPWMCIGTLPHLVRGKGVASGFVHKISKCRLLIFSQIHRHILKNQIMLFPRTFIFALKKIDVGLKKQVANF